MSEGEEDPEFIQGRKALTVKDGIPSSAVDFLRMTQAYSQDEEALTCEVLAANALFRHCDALLPYAAAPKAPRINLKPKEVLELKNRGPAYIIESGVVEVQVGKGPVVIFGAGQVLNTVGFLGIADEAEPFKPSGLEANQLPMPKGGAGRTNGGAYEIFRGQAPSSLFAERRGGRQDLTGPAPGQVCVEDSMCFFSLCPNAVTKLSPPSFATKMNGWLPLRISGGPALKEEEDEDEPDNCATGWRLQPGGGARLVALDLSLVEEVGLCLGEEGERAKALRKALAIFRKQRKVLSDRWRSMITRCCGAFPGMPPEVVWAIAERAEQMEVAAGEVFVKEGDEDEDLILIEEGIAIVEKTVANGDRPSTVEIGQLGATAIIGDIALIGASLPRAASVRAGNVTEILRIPAGALSEVLRRFPGALQGITSRLKEAGNFLMMKLPVRYDVVNSLELFEDADVSFKKEVAAHGKRYVCTIGEVVVDGRQPNDCIYVVEYGVCSLQNELRQELEEVSSGSLFAVSDTVFGISRTPGTLAQVVSPFAAIMEIRQKDLTDALQRHYDKRRPPPFMEEILPAASSLQRLVATTEIFGKVSMNFIQDLCAGAQLRSYLPGQTLCIQAKQDKGQMFLVRGGALFVEKDGRRMHETNTCIGDLVILGAEHQRPCTVRAQTFVFTLEIPKAVFVQAIDKHPDSRRALENYALQTITGRNDDQGGGVQWPMQQAAPQRLSYLLNLYAGVKLYDPAESDWKRLADESAVLVVQGTAHVVDDDGKVVEVLGIGDTFNEQILLGIPGGRLVSGLRFHMREGPCELQFVSLSVWEKVVSDFPQEQDMIFRSIRHTLANKAAMKNHGTAMSSPEMVRMSPLLRYLSQETIQDLARRFEPVVVKPFAEIVTKGRLDSAMYILLSGSACMEAGKRNREYSAGQVFGEAEVLGVSKAYNNTVYANNLCILAALTSADLWNVVQDHPQDALLLEPLCNLEAEAESAETAQSSRLDDRIFQLPMGLEVAADFLAMLCEHIEDSFFGPGEAIFKYGEECLYGVSDMYVLLAGEVDIETDLGVVQARLLPSEVFGEGALGAATQRNASARAWSNAYVHCARIHGASIANALKKFPQETEWFEDLQESRRETNADFMARRNKWLSQEVIPALAKVNLLSIHDELFLADMAAPLIEKQWAAGEVIVQKAADTDAMIVLLEGEARVEAQNGSCIDYYNDGSSFGEMAMLGLMRSNPATVRAATACRTLAVRQSALRRSLDLPTRTPQERQEFQRILAERKFQVETGIPMTLLPIAVSKDDLCAKAIALQAELKPLKPGESWTLEQGGCFCVVTEGRAILELASENERLRRLGGDETPAVPVMPLAQGSLVLEDLAAELGCRVRALTHLKVHRVRYLDFNVATTLESCSQVWLARFRLLESNTQKHLEQRGGAARGVVDALQEHVFNEDLMHYGERRQKAITVNRKLKLMQGTLMHDFSTICPHKLGRMPHPIVNVHPKSWKSPAIPRQSSAPAGLLTSLERSKLKAIQKWPTSYTQLSATFPKVSGEEVAKELWRAKGNKEAAKNALHLGKSSRSASRASPTGQEDTSKDPQRAVRLPDLATQRS